VTFKQLFQVKLTIPSYVLLKAIQLCLKHFFLKSKIKKLFGVEDIKMEHPVCVCVCVCKYTFKITIKSKIKEQILHIEYLFLDTKIC